MKQSMTLILAKERTEELLAAIKPVFKKSGEKRSVTWDQP